MVRLGGNPDFGTKYRFPKQYDKPLSKKALQIRLEQSNYDELMLLPTQERLNLVREAIAKALLERRQRKENGKETN